MSKPTNLGSRVQETDEDDRNISRRFGSPAVDYACKVTWKVTVESPVASAEETAEMVKEISGNGMGLPDLAEAPVMSVGVLGPLLTMNTDTELQRQEGPAMLSSGQAAQNHPSQSNELGDSPEENPEELRYEGPGQITFVLRASLDSSTSDEECRKKMQELGRALHGMWEDIARGAVFMNGSGEYEVEDITCANESNDLLSNWAKAKDDANVEEMLAQLRG